MKEIKLYKKGASSPIFQSTDIKDVISYIDNKEICYNDDLIDCEAFIFGRYCKGHNYPYSAELFHYRDDEGLEHINLIVDEMELYIRRYTDKVIEYINIYLDNKYYVEVLE